MMDGVLKDFLQTTSSRYCVCHKTLPKTLKDKQTLQDIISAFCMSYDAYAVYISTEKLHI